jgi:hypothetical protein
LLEVGVDSSVRDGTTVRELEGFGFAMDRQRRGRPTVDGSAQGFAIRTGEEYLARPVKTLAGEHANLQTGRADLRVYLKRQRLIAPDHHVAKRGRDSSLVQLAYRRVERERERAFADDGS